MDIKQFLQSKDFLEEWSEYDKYVGEPEDLLAENIENITRLCAESSEKLLSILIFFLSCKTPKEFLQFCKNIVLGGDFDTTLKQFQIEGKIYSRMCNVVWQQTAIAYRCLTCGLANSSSLCVGCFKEGDHKGHQYLIYSSSFGGCCDCGNPAVWKPSGNCKLHKGKQHGDKGRALEGLENDKILGEGRITRVILHFLVLLLKRSIVLIKRHYEDDADNESELKPPPPKKYSQPIFIDPYVNGIAKELTVWIDQFASHCDQFRSLVSRELLYCCINRLNPPTTESNPDLSLNNGVHHEQHNGEEKTIEGLNINEFPLTNSSPKWQTDSNVKRCENCDISFSLFNRRHHCRGCGKIFCSKCLVKFPFTSGHFTSSHFVCPPCNQLLLLHQQKNLFDTEKYKNKEMKKKTSQQISFNRNNNYGELLASENKKKINKMEQKEVMSFRHFFHLIEKMKLLIANEKNLELQNYDLKFSLLYRIGSSLSTPLCDALINLYLQLLYDDEFKDEFILVFIDHYQSLSYWMSTLSLESKKQMDDFINRITAQLWNMNEQIQVFSQSGKLDILGIIIETNFKIFTLSVDENSTFVNCSHAIITNELYWSFLTDLITVLSFKPTQLYVMNEREDLIRKWLWIMLLCSFINPIKRLPKREEYENSVWRNSFTLEISVNRSFLPFFSGYEAALSAILNDTPKPASDNEILENLNNIDQIEDILIDNSEDSKHKNVAELVRKRVGLITKQLMEYFRSIKMHLEISNTFVTLPFVPKSNFRFPSPSLCYRYSYGTDHPSQLFEKSLNNDNDVSNEDDRLQSHFADKDEMTIEDLEQINDKEVAVSVFNMMQDPLTFHILIHRILAGFIEKTCALDNTIPLSKILNLSSLPSNFLTLLIEHPLRLSALIAQVRAGLWVFNGGNIVTQIVLYQKNHCCYDDLYDFDILLLQTISVLMGGFSFAAISLNRFQINLLALENLSVLPADQFTILDEYFQFIIIILTQRCKNGQTENMQIQRDLLHRLCLEDQTFSQLENSICTRLTSLKSFETILKSISVHHSASDYNEGRYSLKPEYWKYFDPYFSHYLPREKQIALENYQKYLRSNNLLKEKGIIPTPFFYPIYSQFRTIYSLAYNDINLSMYYSILKNYLNHSIQNHDNLLYSVLYLIQISILATEKSSPIFDDPNSLSSPPQPENYSLLDNLLRRNIYKIKTVQENETEEYQYESILELLIQLFKREVDSNFLPNIKWIIESLSKRSEETKNIISTQLPSLFSSQVDNANKIQQKKNEYRSRQAELMARFKKEAEKSFLKISSELIVTGDDLDDGQDLKKSTSKRDPSDPNSILTDDIEEEEEEDFDQIDCALCRDSISQDKYGYLRNYNQKKRTIAMCGLLQRSNVLKVARKYERDTDIRDIDFLTIDINGEMDNRNKKRRFDSVPKSRKFSISKIQSAILHVNNSAPSLATNNNTVNDNQSKNQKRTDEERRKIRDEILITDANEEEVVDIRYCGHYVHVDCLYRYFSNLCAQHESNNDYEGRRIISLQNSEFICPSCRRLNNCAVPLVARSSSSYTIFPSFDFQNQFPSNDNNNNFESNNIILLDQQKQNSDEQFHLGNLMKKLYENGALDPPADPPLDETVKNNHHDSINPSDSDSNLFESIKTNTENQMKDEETPGNPDHPQNEENKNVIQPLTKNVPPSSPVPPPFEISNTKNYFLDSLNILIKRCSSLDNSMVDVKLLNPLAPNIPSLWLLLNERISSLEIQSRSYLSSSPDHSFFKFLKTQISSELSQDLILIRLVGYFSVESEGEMMTFFSKIENKIWSNILLPKSKLYDNINNEITESNQAEFEFDLFNEDLFNILFILVCAKGNRLTTDYFFHSLQFFYILFIIQILFSLSSNEENDTISIVDIKEKETQIIEWIFSSVNNLETKVENYLLAFLRKSIILFYLLFDGYFELDRFTMESESTEFTQYISLLKFPRVSTALLAQDKSFLSLLFKFWFTPSLNSLTEDNNNNLNTEDKLDKESTIEQDRAIIIRDIDQLKEKKRVKIISKPIAFSLSKLPHLFQEVYQHIATQVCNVCQEITLEPGLCLLCGEFICGGIKHINELSAQLPPQLKSSLNAFVTHAEGCGGGIGVFLMLKLCTILLFRTRRVSIWNSLYLDDHGEEDIELRRGKALHMSSLRYLQLQSLYLTQSFDHDTRILDKTKQLGI